MTTHPKTKLEEHDKVDAKTPNDPENGKLTLEELAVVTGGEGEEEEEDTAWFTSPGPDWS